MTVDEANHRDSGSVNAGFDAEETEETEETEVMFDDVVF
jgi:hypothetical protein